MTDRILLMGGTGTVGTYLRKELDQHDIPVRACTRDNTRIINNPGSDTEWVYFDLDRPETFIPALDDATRLFMISRPGDEEADKTAAELLRAVRQSKISHITYLSAMGAEERPDFSSRRVEILIEKSSIPHTFLRPNFFMEIFTHSTIAGTIREHNLISVPAADAGLSFIAASDVAAAAAEIITNPDSHNSKAYTLTGNTALSHYTAASILSRTLHRRISYQPLPHQSLTELLKLQNMPEDRISRLDLMYTLVREGRCEPVTADLNDLLHRPAQSFEEFAGLSSTRNALTSETPA